MPKSTLSSSMSALAAALVWLATMPNFAEADLMLPLSFSGESLTPVSLTISANNEDANTTITARASWSIPTPPNGYYFKFLQVTIPVEILGANRTTATLDLSTQTEYGGNSGTFTQSFINMNFLTALDTQNHEKLSLPFSISLSESTPTGFVDYWQPVGGNPYTVPEPSGFLLMSICAVCLLGFLHLFQRNVFVERLHGEMHS